MIFEKFIDEKIIRGNEKITILIGSGLHKQVFSDCSTHNNNLTSWSFLLKSICSEIELSENYLLDFESIILKKTNSVGGKEAFRIENNLLKEVTKNIKSTQKFAIQNLAHKYPIEILNPKYVSDIISLNFDTTIEELFKHNYKSFKKISNKEKDHLFTNIKNTDKNFSNSIYFNEYRCKNDCIKFWYPHGSINRPTSLILSLRKYGMHLSVLEKLRMIMKIDERTNNYKIPKNRETWFSQLVQNNVLILGASISDYEWDILFALVNRKRNFAKNSNSKIEKFIFQMKISEAESNTSIIRNNWFLPLFDKKLDANTQWNLLSKILSK